MDPLDFQYHNTEVTPEPPEEEPTSPEGELSGIENIGVTPGAVPGRTPLPAAPVVRPGDYTEEEDEYGAWDAIKGGALRENWWMGAIDNGTILPHRHGEWDRNYDWKEDEANKNYPASSMIEARSAEDAAMMRAQIDRQRDDYDAMNSSAWGIVGAIGGALLNPEVWVGGGIGAARGLGWKGMTGIAATEAGVTETILQAQQAERTALESVINAGTAGMATALLGKGAQWYRERGALPPPRQDDLLEGPTLEGSPGWMGPRAPDASEVANGAPVRVRGEDSAGAARVEEIPENWINRAVIRLSIGPMSRVLASKSMTAKNLIQDLAENPFHTTAGEMGKGRATPIEALRTAAAGRTVAVIEETRPLAKQAKEQFGMDRTEFEEAVGRALSNADEGNNEFVSQAAKLYRDKVLDPVAQELRELELLPPTKGELTVRMDDLTIEVGDLKAQVATLRAKADAAKQAADAARAAKDKPARDAAKQEAAQAEAEIRKSLKGLAKSEKKLKRDTDMMERMEAGEDLADSYAPRIYDADKILENWGYLKETLVTHLRDTHAAAVRAYDTAVAERATLMGGREGYITRMKEAHKKRVADAQAKHEKRLDDWELESERAVETRAAERKAHDEDVAIWKNDHEQVVAERRIQKKAKMPKEEWTPLPPKPKLKQTPMPPKPKLVKPKALKAPTVKEWEAQVDARPLPPKPKDVDPQEFDDFALDIMDNMMGGLPVTGKGTRSKGGLPGHLQGRVLQLSDNELAPFRETNASVMMSRYTDGMAPFMEMHKRFGDTSLIDDIAAIQDEYRPLIDAAPTAKEKNKLIKQRDQDVEDIEMVRDRVMHRLNREQSTAGATERTLRAVQVWNLTTQLGGVVLTSLPDVARPLMAYGFRSYAKGLATTMGRAFQSEAMRLASRVELNRLGVALERVRNQRAMDLTDAALLGSNRTTRRVGEAWGKWTGFNWWTDTMESISAHSAMDWTLRQAKQVSEGGNLTRAARGRLSRMGFDDALLEQVYREVQGAKAPNDGLMAANTLNWTNPQLAKTFEAGVGSDVRRAIIRVGAGDKPKMMDSVTWQWLLQYQTFAMAATNRMLAAGIQQRDMALVGGLLASIAAGAGVGGTKAYLRGDDPSEWEPQQWLLEGLDRSGVVGIWSPAFRFLSYGLGYTPSRYAQREWESIVPSAGPTVGNFGNLYRAGKAAFEGQWQDEGDKKGALEYGSRAVPFLSNTLHLRQLLLQMAED